MRGTRSLRLLLVLAVLSAFTITAIDYRSGEGSSPFDVVRRGTDAALGPVQRAIGSAAHTVTSALGLGTDPEEVRQLKADNDRLRAQLAQTDALRTQVREWNELLHLKDAQDLSVVPAKVVSLGSSLGFELTATIDVGARDGIKPGQTVVDGKGLVGRTKRVSDTTSLIVLLADRDFGVGIRLSRSGRLGLATGDGVGAMTYQLLGQSDRAEVGDAVFTSGSATFVAGIPVGTVTTIDSDPNALTRSGALQPFVDVTALDLVGVVLDGPRTTPRAPLPRPTPARPSPAASP